jgi:hypothetical protein
VLKEEYENHQERKVKAREEKKRDKELAKFLMTSSLPHLTCKQF